MDKAWLTMTITERKMPNTAAAQDFWVSCPGEDDGGKMSNGTQETSSPMVLWCDASNLELYISKCMYLPIPMPS